MQSSPTTASTGNAAQNGSVIVSRFGEVSVDLSKAVVFPGGMLGIPDKTRYVVVPFPGEKMQQFMLLQSLDDPSLSFITLPLGGDNTIIAPNDISSAAQDLQIASGNLVTLLVVSVHRSPGQVKLSVNARAPIFIDAVRQTGTQYVFQSDQYKVQHML